MVEQEMSDKKNSIQLPCGVDHQLPFLRSQCQRLLYEDILARTQRRKPEFCVGFRRCNDRQCVQFGILQDRVPAWIVFDV